MNDAAALLLEVSSFSNPRRALRSISSARRVRVAAGLALATMLPGVAPAAAQEQEPVAARIARENLPSVVTLIALDDRDQPLALGSGFFVTRDGVLVTNAHVVSGAARVLVRWRGQSGVAVKILNFAKKYDLVTIQTSFTSTPAVLLADSDTAAAGQDVVVLGSPQGLEGTVSTGIIGGLRTIAGARHLRSRRRSAPSGDGPVFNTGARDRHLDGHVAKGQNLNFALPVNLLRDVPPAAITFAAVKPAPFDLRDGDRLKDLVYFNNIIEEFGLFAEGSTLNSLTASLQNRTSDTISDIRVLVVVKSPRGEVLDFHLRDYKGTVIPPGLAKQVAIPISTRGFRMWGSGIDYDRGSYEIRLLDYKVVSSRSEDPIKRR
jgi:S1-C subfamily serine protease